MKEIQKFIEAVLVLVFGIIFLSALPKEAQIIGFFSFGLMVAAAIVLIVFWFFKNFLDRNSNQYPFY